MVKNSVSIIKAPTGFGKITGEKIRHGDIFRFKDGEVVYMALDEFYSDEMPGDHRGRRKIVALTTGNVYPLNPIAEVKVVGQGEAVQIARTPS